MTAHRKHQDNSTRGVELHQREIVGINRVLEVIRAEDLDRVVIRPLPRGTAGTDSHDGDNRENTQKSKKEGEGTHGVRKKKMYFAGQHTQHRRDGVQ